MKTLLWALIAVNFLSSVFTVVHVIYRARKVRQLDALVATFQRQADEATAYATTTIEHAQASEEAMAKVIANLMPAIAFCAALRDDPRAPETIRRTAAAVIPKEVHITTGPDPIASTTGKVH